MPNPFRHYEGVPLLDLPADPLSPGFPTLRILAGEPPAATQPSTDGAAFLSQLFFYSAAISAAKRVPATGAKYALRVNPSSGNLHPTEFHFVTQGLADWPDGLYHYRSSSHMAEQRATGRILPPEQQAPVTFLLSTIAWREAWKYRERAYRYCLLDIGHAWQALDLSAAALGCSTTAMGQFDDDEVAKQWGLAPDEWPMLLIEIAAGAVPLHRSSTADTWYGGEPNRLSLDPIAYPLIEDIHEATKRLRVAAGHSLIVEPSAKVDPSLASRPLGETVRARRSALDFRGGTMSFDELMAILRCSIGQRFASDFSADPNMSVFAYIHDVRDLDAGAYRYSPPGGGGLERIMSGKQRAAAAGLSLGQDLAGNACAAFSIVANLERFCETWGDRGYRYAHFEAGAIGHRMYLAAEALGLRATGIGAFFDEKVHQYLGIRDGYVVYHFAIGHAVADDRLDA